MGDFGKTTRDTFDPHRNPKPEPYQAAPAYNYTPVVETPSQAEQQQQAALLPGTQVSPLLQNPYGNVVESPALGMGGEDEVSRRSRSQSGGMGV